MNHVKTLMENKGYAELINTSGPNNENLTYSVTLPVREKFLSVFKYKCRAFRRFYKNDKSVAFSLAGLAELGLL